MSHCALCQDLGVICDVDPVDYEVDCPSFRPFDDNDEGQTEATDEEGSSNTERANQNPGSTY